MSYVFVYGTLLKGCSNHNLLSGKGSTLIEPEARVTGHLYHLGGFPGASLVGLSNTLIKGELYNVNNEVLSRLDHLEGYRGEEHRRTNLYNRVTTPIFNRYGQVIAEGIVYEINRTFAPDAKTIPSGDWRNQEGEPLLYFDEQRYDEDDEDGYED